MKIHEISIIGTFHTDHNEDFQIINEIGEGVILIAVMDGCSMGKESHFASILIGKTLRKIAKELSFKNFAEKRKLDLKALLKDVLGMLFGDLRIWKSKLMLERDEFLSTLLLGIVDVKGQQAELLAIGDGLICCDGKLFEFEQDNKPDYIGYHLSEDFESWFQTQTQKLSFTNFEDLSISTDGIFTFKKADFQESEEISEAEIVQLLLIDSEGLPSANLLKLKLKDLENQYGLKPSDDLSIIRIQK